MATPSTAARSTAPIALLLVAGFGCLAASFVIPTTVETQTYPDVTAAGESASQAVVSSSVEPVPMAVAIALLVLAVVAFAKAGHLIYRRIRR